ncbi:MAG: glycoside hydrolase domain-containing protein [Solirubrobacteraceae bacterium]
MRFRYLATTLVAILGLAAGPTAAAPTARLCSGGNATHTCVHANLRRQQQSLRALQREAKAARSNAKAGSSPLFGIDMAFSAVSPAQAKALGAHFVSSYLSFSAAKDWTASEWKGLHAEGIATVLNWEWGCCDATEKHNHAVGQRDARQALAEANALGARASRPIIFSVDENVPWRAAAGYFAGASSIIGKSRVGIYGSYQVVAGAYAAGYRGVWQTSAWSNGAWFPHDNLEQYAYPSPSYDADLALTRDYGQSPPPPPIHMRGLAHATGAYSWTYKFWGVHGTKGTWRSGVENFEASAELQVHLCQSTAGAWRIAALPRNAPPLGSVQRVSWSTVRGLFAGFDATFDANNGSWSVRAGGGSWHPPAGMCGWLSAEVQFQTRTGRWRIKHLSLNAGPLGG